jgi:signal transduction histidine kinase
MISQEKRLFCRLDGLTTEAREQQRLKTITLLGLLQTESIPVFEEATQTAAQTLEMPICYLGLMEPERERFKAAIGLSRLGLMNELASLRQLPRLETFSTHVVDSQQLLIVEDTLAHPAFANQLLVNQYGIRSFMGAPLVTSSGWCIGTLAVMDTTPRTFSQKDAEFLSMMARWSMSEYERSHAASNASVAANVSAQTADSMSISSQIRVDLLSHLAQELRTPLTSVMGMASVLMREIYGPLTTKQKEYLNIIHNSGQYLLSLMSEIVELSEFKESNQSLNLTSVDMEMLCQQAINTLEHAAQRREQKIRLTVEPNRRIWPVDKEKVRQMLYHLIFSVIQSSTAGSIIRLHISRRENNLNLAIWVSHPWLGEGLPYLEVCAEPSLVTSNSNGKHHYEMEEGILLPTDPPEDGKLKVLNSVDESSQSMPRQNLGLMLCQQLAELHHGQIVMQGSEETGARYIISLPRLTDIGEN